MRCTDDCLLLLQILVEQIDGEGWLAHGDQLGQVVGIARQFAHRLGLLAQEVLLQIMGHLGIVFAVLCGAVGGAGVHVNGAVGQLLLVVQGTCQRLQLVEVHLWWMGNTLVMGLAEVDGAAAACHLLDELDGIVKAAIRKTLVELLEAGSVHLVRVEVGGQEQILIRLLQLQLNVVLQLWLQMSNGGIACITIGDTTCDG